MGWFFRSKRHKERKHLFEAGPARTNTGVGSAGDGSDSSKVAAAKITPIGGATNQDAAAELGTAKPVPVEPTASDPLSDGPLSSNSDTPGALENLNAAKEVTKSTGEAPKQKSGPQPGPPAQVGPQPSGSPRGDAEHLLRRVDGAASFKGWSAGYSKTATPRAGAKADMTATSGPRRPHESNPYGNQAQRRESGETHRLVEPARYPVRVPVRPSHNTLMHSRQPYAPRPEAMPSQRGPNTIDMGYDPDTTRSSTPSSIMFGGGRHSPALRSRPNFVMTPKVVDYEPETTIDFTNINYGILLQEMIAQGVIRSGLPPIVFHRRFIFAAFAIGSFTFFGFRGLILVLIAFELKMEHLAKIARTTEYRPPQSGSPPISQRRLPQHLLS